MADPAEIRQRIASLSPEQRAKLERWLVDSRPTPTGDLGIPRRDPSVRECPLSHAQERLWVLQQLEPGLIAYNIPRGWRLEGRLDVDALRRAFEALVERHEVLRTTYRAGDPEPVQVIADRDGGDLRVVDLEATPAASRSAEATRLFTEEIRRPFDLAVDPVLRRVLIRLGPDEHLLVVTNHHIASDGWSAGILTRELSALYTALSQGRALALPPLPIQYADYALWQRGALETALQGQVEYWRRQLDGAPPELALPADHPRPRELTYRGARQFSDMPAELGASLRALARRERVTPFMLLMSAFFALLSRYTGREDLVVGTVIAGRTRVEMEPLLGFFVNTLAMRVDVSGDPPFRDLVQRVRAVALQAFAHQELPFARVVQEVRPERRLDRSPLVQVMFVVQDVNARAEPAFPDVTVSPLETETSGAQFDLSLAVTDTGAGLKVRAEYSTDLFEPETVRRFVRHFQTLLEGVVADPATRLSALPVLSAPERRQALVEWNPPAPADAAATAPIHRLVEAQAARRPEAVAVTLGAERLSYGDLNARANRLARALRAAGVGPERLVGICVEPSLDLIVGLLAILKAGGAYVPMDSAYPAERLAFMLDDAGVAVLLTHRAHVPHLPAGGPVPVICLDDGAGADESGEDLDGSADPQQLAYVIYTSGSTGRPKGVLVTHANVVRLFTATRAWFEFGETDVWTLFHSSAFDFSVWEMWGALTHGGRLVVVPYLTGRSPDAFDDLLRAEGVTVLSQTPSAFRQLVPVAAARPGASALRAVVFGGEALDLRSLAPWVDRYGDRAPRLINMYGITETTVHVSYRPLAADEIRHAAGSRIGGPIPDLQLYLLDRGLEPVPIGVPGELFVGGAGLARGYLNQPALTAERFVPDPFGHAPGARLYRTGDLARRLPDGDIEYLGRADQQVKIRGFRIELGEIEGVLRAHPAVRDAAVAVREVGPEDARLVAYVVFDADPVPSAELRAALRTMLPEHMVPAAFVPLQALPLTSSGKLDRRALPAGLDALAESAAAPADAGGDPLARELAATWARVLRVPHVGLHDNFFDLGGHSLLAVRLVAEVQRRWQVALPMVTLFRAPTVAAMAELLTAERAASLSSSLVPIQPAGALPPLFCVPEHTGTVLCFEQLARQLAPDQPVYGLEPLGLDGRGRPHNRIEDMAAHYLRELRAVQPAGPFHLAGYCFGGLVALEMAQQLRAGGEEVALLALFNTYGPERREHAGAPPLRRIAGRARRRIEVELANLRPLRLHQQVAYLVAQAVRVGTKVKDRIERVRARGRDVAPHLAQVALAHSEAMRAYAPRPYDGPLTLFWARHRFARSFVDPCFGWRRAAKRLDVRLIPATRGSVVQDPEAVRIAAVELKQLVARAAARG